MRPVPFFRLPRHPAFRLCIAPALLALAACSGPSDEPAQVAVIGDAGSPFVSGARLPMAAQLVRSATAEGLVGLDEQGRVIPALADRWIVTDGGQSFIFRLRDGEWPDGTRIGGENVRTALRQALAALRGTPMGVDLEAVEDVRAMAGRVVEIRLSHPMPDLLQLLAQPELGLVRQGRGAGPMKLARDGQLARLSPIDPETLGRPAIEEWDARARKVDLRALPAERAIAAFDAAEIDMVLGGRIEDFPRATAAGLSRGTLRLDPVMGLFGLAVSGREGFLAVATNREALAMAIDREALIAPFGIADWTPTTRIVGAGAGSEAVVVGERWNGMSTDQRRAEAAARVARWRDGDAAPVLMLAMPAGPGSDILFQKLSADFAAIGIDVRRVAENRAADLRLVDVVARYAGPGWFLNQFNCRIQRGQCSPLADRKAGEARRAINAAVAANLWAEAEAELMAANAFIPFGPPVRWSLVRGDAVGFAPSRWGFHPLMPMALLPR